MTTRQKKTGGQAVVMVLLVLGMEAKVERVDGVEVVTMCRRLLQLKPRIRLLLRIGMPTLIALGKTG